ncbi:MAG TPA: hypothetical protein VH867_04205 [Burkholderiales bacterium]|jgi:hypothetical protein
MAKKPSVPILNRLRKLIEPAPEGPRAPKESGKRSGRQAPASAADPVAEDTNAARAPEPGKKKTPKQPWYRHRQRW